MNTVGWDRPWLRYPGIALAYAGGFWFLHLFYFADWQLTAGFRLACLLLVPTRYWPALFVGEAMGLTKFAYDCADQLGLLWALAAPITSMTLAMPVLYLLRKYRPVIDAQNRVVIGSLLVCILAATLLNTGANVLEFALMHGLPPEQRWSIAHVTYFSYLWFLGTGLGIYMIVPLVLWAYTEGQLHLRDISTRILQSQVLREAVAIFLPCIYLPAYTIEYSHLELVKHLCQFAMLITPAWFAVRYGWQGASLTCMLANLAVVLSMPARHDPGTLQAQELMMVSSTLWLLLGARISVLRPRNTRLG